MLCLIQSKIIKKCTILYTNGEMEQIDDRISSNETKLAGHSLRNAQRELQT